MQFKINTKSVKKDMTCKEEEELSNRKRSMHKKKQPGAIKERNNIEKCTRNHRAQVDHGKGEIGGTKDFLCVDCIRAELVRLRRHLSESLLQELFKW